MNEIKKIIEFKRTEIGEFLKVFFSKNIENWNWKWGIFTASVQFGKSIAFSKVSSI